MKGRLGAGVAVQVAFQRGSLHTCHGIFLFRRDRRIRHRGRALFALSSAPACLGLLLVNSNRA